MALIIIVLLGTILLWMLGGQINKLVRHIGVTILLTSYTSFQTRSLWLVPFLSYGAILSLGYGDKSLLMRWLKNQRLVKAVYATLLAIPPVVCGMLLGHGWVLALYGVNLAVWQLELGSWGTIKYKENGVVVKEWNILGDDVVRGLALAVQWVVALA